MNHYPPSNSFHLSVLPAFRLSGLPSYRQLGSDALHLLDEFSEVRAGIPRSGSGFGVVLDAARIRSLDPNALNRTIVQVELSYLSIGSG